MKPCDRCLELVSAHLEGETSPAEARFMDEHLASCETCPRSLEEVRALLTHLESLPRVETSPGFSERVLARTHGLRPAGLDAPDVIHLPRRRPVSWAVPLAAAAALALAWFGVRPVLQGPPRMPAAVEPAATPATAPQEDLADLDARTPIPPPEVVTLGGEEGQSLGMVRDTYILGTYELRAPAEGGAPILTRASSLAEAPVTITF